MPPLLGSIGADPARAYGFSLTSGPKELWAPMSAALYSTNTGTAQYPRGAVFSPYTATPSAFPQNNLWTFGATQWTSGGAIAGSLCRFSASAASAYPTRSSFENTFSQDSNTAGSKCFVGDAKFFSEASLTLFYYGGAYFSYSSGWGAIAFRSLTQTAASSYSTANIYFIGNNTDLSPTNAVNIANGAFAFTNGNCMNVYGAKETASQTSATYIRCKVNAPQSFATKNVNFASGATNDTGGSGFACSASTSALSLYLVIGIIRSSLKGIAITKWDTTTDTILWTQEITNSTYNIDSITLWPTPTSVTSAAACQANYGFADENANLYVASCVKYAAGNWRPIIFKFDSSGNLLSQWEYNLTAGNREWKVGSLVYNRQTSSMFMMAMNNTDTSKVYVIKFSISGDYISQTVIDISQSSTAGSPNGSISVNNTGEYFAFGGSRAPATGGTTPAGISVLLPTNGTYTGTYGTGSTTVGSIVVSYDSNASTWTVNKSSTTGTATAKTYTVTSSTYTSVGSGSTGSVGVLNTAGYF